MLNQQYSKDSPISSSSDPSYLDLQNSPSQTPSYTQGQFSKSSKMIKKFSINTASSNMEQESQQMETQSKYTKQQFLLSNIQLLQKQNKCLITQLSNQIYPSSFALINVSKKLQKVTLKQLMELNFSVLSYSIKQLIDFSTQIIYSNQHAQTIFTKQKMEELITAIATNYNKTSYHNFSHAFSLMQLNFQCIQLMPQFKQFFTPQEIFYTFISGLSHDLNHNGTNNMFEVKRKTQLALKYHNQSVLENMHISTLWKILKQRPQLNFLTFSNNQNKAKQTITKLILSTDMSSHFKNLELLQKRRKEKNIDFKHAEDRMFMMQQIFHSCDLGNPTLQYDSYISWAALLSYQFNEQAKLEKVYNVEVTKNFQYKNFSTLYNDQVWFVGKIVHPLWKEICLHLPQLNVLKRRIEENTQILNEKLTEEELKART